MTGDFVPSESRSKPLCRALTTKGKPCRGKAIADGLCLAHSGVVDVREAGRKGGKARGRKREQRGSFRQAVASVLGRDPEKHAERLLSAGAAGYKLAAELLAVEEAREQEREAGPLYDPNGRPIVGLVDVVWLVYELKAEGVVGLPQLSPEQIAELEAARDRRYEVHGGGDPVPVAEGETAREIDGVPFPSRTTTG